MYLTKNRKYIVYLACICVTQFKVMLKIDRMSDTEIGCHNVELPYADFS